MFTNIRHRAAGAAAVLSVVGAALAGSGCDRDRRPLDVEVVQTSGDLSQRLTRLRDLHFGTGSRSGLPVIRVDDARRYQRVVGVGAAITDSSAWLLHRLPDRTRAAVMSALFSSSAIHLGFVRVPIGASDFTANGQPYSYDDRPPGRSDPSLRSFSVRHDDKDVIPILRQMLRVNPRVEIFASPWSPPAWMKTNDSLGNYADGGRLLADAYQPLADYFVKFIRAYARRRVEIAAISPQNEPGQAAKYPALNLPESTEAMFITRYLAPTLAAAGLHPLIYAHDFKWLFWRRARALADNASVARDISGIAWHCYDGNPRVMTSLHDAHPQMDQIESECSSGIAPGPSSELMIASFRNWASGVLLWNVALDPHGGPVQAPNKGCGNCTPVITVDERSHTVKYLADYYELGQFSAFVQPGARRVASNNFVTYNTPRHGYRVNYATPGIDDVAFVNPNGSRVLLVHSNADRSMRLAVEWRGKSFVYTLPAQATVTFRWV
jgi:glucosylceramidase